MVRFSAILGKLDMQTDTQNTSLPLNRGSFLDPDNTENQDWLRRSLQMFAVIFGLWHIATNIWLYEPGFWQNAIHFGGFALIAAIIGPRHGRFAHSRGVLIFDLIYGLLVFAAAMWVAGNENDLYQRTLKAPGEGWDFNLIDYLAGGLVIIAAIDLTRRLTGWIIPILIIFSLAFLLFLGEMMPGIFRTASIPAADVLFRSLYNDEGMFGTITTISSANITLFMIFGSFLVYSGASEFIIEISKFVVKRFRGGSAYVAVLSSALTGTVSGSAVANTASTGVITIPLMKSNGFRPAFAGGVETAASTGGQIMPPIMGAGAFVMVSYTGISYGTIVSVSILPAILYFLSVAFAVRIETMRDNIHLNENQAVDWQKIRAGALNFVVPLTVLIGMLVSGWTPNFAVAHALGILVVCSWLTPYKMNHTRIYKALVGGIRTGAMTAILLTAVGLFNNAVTTSGVGGSFSLMIVQWSHGSLIIALVLIAIASLVLGMGLPVTAAYIVLAILVAPSLANILADEIVIAQLANGVTDASVLGILMLADPSVAGDLPNGLGMDGARALVDKLPIEIAPLLREAMVPASQLASFLLVSHLIIFWLSQDSNVTPPVCLAAFAAAGIAGSRPFETGVQAWKIAKGLYIMPLLFAYTPLITGDFWQIMQTGFFACFGLYATHALIQRHGEAPLQWWGYALLLIGAVGSYWPSFLVANIVGALAVMAVVLAPKMNKPKMNKYEV